MYFVNQNENARFPHLYCARKIINPIYSVSILCNGMGNYQISYSILATIHQNKQGNCIFQS